MSGGDVGTVVGVDDGDVADGVVVDFVDFGLVDDVVPGIFSPATCR